MQFISHDRILSVSARILCIAGIQVFEDLMQVDSGFAPGFRKVVERAVAAVGGGGAG